MRKKVFKLKNMVVALFAAAILILSIFVCISDAVDYLKERFWPANATYDGAYVQMLDVGQGDSVLLVSSGKAALIDTGIKGCAAKIKKTLKAKNIKTLDMLLITHNHTDHMGGVDVITGDIPVKTLVIPDLKFTDERTDKMERAKENVISSGGKCVTAKKGTSIDIGEFNISVIGAYYTEKDENDRSIITMAKIGKWKFLFTGDAQDSAEKRLMEDNISIKCDVLKVGHHGSMYSSSEEFLEAASPNLAMISCGRGNRYSHPHDVVLLRLKQAGIQYYRTDTNGNIKFDITEKEITVETEK